MNDKNKLEDFNGVLLSEESTWRSNSKTTWKLSSSNSFFGSTHFHTEISFS